MVRRASLALLLLARVAAAQTTPPPAAPPTASTGIAADRFTPGLGPDAQLAGEGAATTPFGHVSFVAGLSYVDNPIRLENRFSGEVVSHPVAGQLNLNLAVEAGLWKWLSFAVGLPITVYAAGDRLQNTELAVGADARPLAAVSAGDFRMRLKASLIRARPDASGVMRWPAVEVALAMTVTVPTTGQSDFAANDTVTVEPRLIVDLRLPRTMLFAAFGVRFAGDRTLFYTRLGDEWLWLGGVAVEAWRRGRFALGVSGEASGAVGGGDGTRPVELRGGLRLGLDAFTLDLAAGGGVDHDVTAPRWRFLALLRGEFDVRQSLHKRE